MREAASNGRLGPEGDTRKARRLGLLCALRRAREELGRWSSPPASMSPGGPTPGSSAAGAGLFHGGSSEAASSVSGTAEADAVRHAQYPDAIDNADSASIPELG
jgi:hypothetical protein